MEQTGTLYISIPVNSFNGGKLVTVSTIRDCTEKQAREIFVNWKIDNPDYQACAKWKTERVAFF